MKAKIVTTYIGIFGVDEEKEDIIDFRKFKNDAKFIAKRLSESDSGFTKEEKEIEKSLKEKGYDEIEKGDSDFISGMLPKLAVEKGVVKTQAEFNKLVSDVNIKLTKEKIKESVGKDKLIIQVVGAIEEMDKSSNILIERLREWYGLHFPEMSKRIKDNEKYAEIVSEFGCRQSIEHPDLSHFKNKSMGMEFSKNDCESVKEFADSIEEMYETREKMSDYMDSLLKEVAPNTREIAGPMLAAKLISLAGGLDKLARMPSSTIQLLGAEKALFRHLKGKGRSPKHGVIIMHPYVQKSPKELNGKIARLIASKISISAKMDQYSNKHVEKKLKKELDEKVNEVVEHHKRDRK